jgi:glycosyltransferase involved in cell wall biosynthesis
MVTDALAPTLPSERSRPVSAPSYLLSVAIPVYNEKNTLLQILERIRAVPVPMEILLVDDGSTDGTRELLKSEVEGVWDNVRVLYHPQNKGKGAAIVTAIGAATGDYLIVQDADLEYNPEDYPRLLAPLLSGEAQVVYGSRFAGKIENMQPANRLANFLLTNTANLLFPGARLTDEATCYKVFKMDVLRQFTLSSQRFDFCPEVTAKVLKRGIKIHELPVNYRARTMAQGKKIRPSDFLQALWTLIKYRVSD